MEDLVKHGVFGWHAKGSTWFLVRGGLRIFKKLQHQNALRDNSSQMRENLLNGRSVWETVRFLLTQPRTCHISTIYFQGPTREDLEC